MSKQVVLENIHKEKPNWLLYSLIAVSILIHAGIFLQMSGRFSFKKTSYIEVGVRKYGKPHSRPAPVPKIRKMAEPLKSSQARVQPDYTMPVVAPVPKAVENLSQNRSMPDSPSFSDDIPEEVPVEVVDFSLPEVEPSGGFGSRMDYLDMVRLKIESGKQYPPFSRQRNIEGIVTVDFIIGSDGYISGLSVAESSGFPSLDKAAMLAVNRAVPFPAPPEKYFKGSVRVKVPIAFELIQ